MTFEFTKIHKVFRDYSGNVYGVSFSEKGQKYLIRQTDSNSECENCIALYKVDKNGTREFVDKRNLERKLYVAFKDLGIKDRLELRAKRVCGKKRDWRKQYRASVKSIPCSQLNASLFATEILEFYFGEKADKVKAKRDMLAVLQMVKNHLSCTLSLNNCWDKIDSTTIKGLVEAADKYVTAAYKLLEVKEFGVKE